MSGNPCDICVVKPSCTSVCPDKENYGVFLEMGKRNLESSHGHYLKKGMQLSITIRKQQVTHRKKMLEHELDIREITIKNNGERLYKEEHKPFEDPVMRRIRKFRKISGLTDY